MIPTCRWGRELVVLVHIGIFIFIGTIILAYLPDINQFIPFTELDFIHSFEPVCLIYYLEMDLIFVPVIPLLLLIYA